MAKPPKGSGKRPGDKTGPARETPPDERPETQPEMQAGTPPREDASATPSETGERATTPASETGGREDFADEAELRPTGRDDDLDGDDGIEHPEGARTAATGESAPSLEGSPIGPGAEHAPTHADEHEARSGFAATALKILIFVLVILGLSLWLVPMVAPHLPAGLARVLMPGQAELDQRLAALAERIEQNTAQITADVSTMRADLTALGDQLQAVEQTATTAQTESQSARAAAEESAAAAETNIVAGESVARAEAAAREASGLADTAATAATEAGKVASAAARDTASLARRMTEFDARLAALSDQIEAVNESLAEGGADGETAAPELAAAFAGLKAEVATLEAQLGQTDLVTETEAQRFATQDDLRSARTALEAQIAKAIAALPPADRLVLAEQLDQLRQNAEARVSEVAGRVDEVATTAANAADTASAAEQAASEALGRVDDAIRQASLRSAAAALTSRFQNGLPYAAALAEVAELQGTPAPAALAAPAETGVATTAELIRRFGQPARAAIEADIETRAGDGLLSQAGARVRSVVAGRPASEQPGDSVEAILSRVEARLREGDPAAALAEAETLPEPARAALGEWLDELRTRVAATEAAAGWLGPAGSEG